MKPLTSSGRLGVVCFAFLIPALAFAASPSESPSKPLSADDAQSLVNIVAAAIQNNYSRGRTIRARVRVVSERPGLLEKEETVLKVPGVRGGHTSIMRNYPRQEFTLDCLLQDHDYLVTENYEKRNVLRSAVDGRWTYYPTDGTMAWIYGRAQAPNRRPCDPRSIGLPTDLLPLEWYLRNNRVLSARRTRSATAELVEIAVADEKERELDFVFDPGQQFMPIKITQRRPNHSVAVDTTIEYQTIDGDAVFLNSALQLFHDDEPTVEVAAIGKRMTWKVVECTVLQDRLDKSAFAVKIPAGVSVSDATTGTFVSGAPKHVKVGVTISTIWRTILVLASLVMIVLGIVVSICRKRLHPT